ncbi:MAG: HDOD domain-containing protein [Syntrophaceae bacterium]|nr:HDOD domain-containing protein [Syntrophaceae bacterium]
MEQKGMTENPVIEMSKAMLVSSFNTMKVIQENMVDLYLSAMPIIPDNLGHLIKGLLKIHHKGREMILTQIIKKYEQAGFVFPLEKAEAVDADMILREVEEKILGKMDFGFNPDILKVLSNPNSSQKDIEALKGRISPDVLACIMNIANSAYFGSLKKGRVKTFYEAVILLGTKHTEVLILYFSLFVLVKDREAESILAKSFARYVLGGYVYARDFGLNAEATFVVELGCLFMDVGKIVLYLYKAKYPEDYERFDIDEAFINSRHAYLGRTICKRLNIPEDLTRIIFNRHFTLDAKHISLSGIMKTVYAVVESLFDENGGKIVITSPMPDEREKLTHSFGVVMQDLFNAVGLSRYLTIIHTQPSSPLDGPSKSGDTDTP